MDAKKKLEKEIARLSFSMDELRLFLDTHPTDCEALAAFNRLKTRRRDALEKYEQSYGPMDAYSAGGTDKWNWLCQPWPWQNKEG